MTHLWPIEDRLDQAQAKRAVDAVQAPLWVPFEDSPQLLALHSPADELFYGGAAGGGKTDLLLGAAITMHQRSIIFRREYVQLRNIIERGKEIIGNAARWNGQDYLWRFDDGRVIELGAVQTEDSVNKFQGRPHDLKAFDELPHFSKAQYTFLNGWKRTADPSQRTRTIAAGNPPTDSEGRWVIEYWAPWLDDRHPNPAQPGELRWFAMVDGVDTELAGGDPFEHAGELIIPRSRTFIGARVEDNPFYMATGYKAQLQALPEPLRTMMLKGMFNAAVEDNIWQVIPTSWVKAAQERWKSAGRPSGVPLTGVAADIARGGADKTVISERYGEWFASLHKHAGAVTASGQASAALILQVIGSAAITPKVDVIGYGASTVDALRAGGHPCLAVNVGTASHARDKSGKFGFVNLRSELYWRMREALDPESGDGLMLPDDPEIVTDLCSARWEPTSGGRIKVESKDDIKKRIGRSPDCGDALLLNLINPSLPIAFVEY